MTAPPPAEPESPEEALGVHAARLIDSVARNVGPWACWHIERLGGSDRWSPSELEFVGAAAVDQVMTPLSALLSRDIDDQTTTPLSVLARVADAPTEFLRAAGVAPVVRDPFDEARDPGDVYGLIPRTWSDLGEEVAEAGMAWGAAKAFVHLARRRGASG